MIRRLASLALVASVFAALGCSSSSSSEEPTTEEGALETSQKVEGAMKVTIDGHKVKLAYQLGKINMNARSAEWNAQVLDNGGHPTMSDDVNVGAKITSVARCPGCFAVTVPGGRSGTLAVVNVDSWKATNVEYEGVRATLLDPEEEANNSGGSSGNAGNANDIGACTMSCSGGDTCKNDVKRGDCNVDSGLFPRLRCMTTFSFVKGGTCPR